MLSAKAYSVATHFNILQRLGPRVVLQVCPVACVGFQFSFSIFVIVIVIISIRLRQRLSYDWRCCDVAAFLLIFDLNNFRFLPTSNHN